MFTASTNGHFEIVKELLARGCDIDSMCHDGSTSLIFGKFLIKVF